MNLAMIRIGHGYDVHRFSDVFLEDKPLKLCGLVLPEQRSLLAHSDGDVVLHAVCDAVLGGIGGGDIGQHFPDTDATFAGEGSGNLLRQVLVLAEQKGLKPINVDVTVIAQVPKLTPHRTAMAVRLAELLALAPGSVNIKATTTEGLGYIGREEGIACHCVMLLGAEF